MRTCGVLPMVSRIFFAFTVSLLYEIVKVLFELFLLEESRPLWSGNEILLIYFNV
jgi:hypothetical protein